MWLMILLITTVDGAGVAVHGQQVVTAEFSTVEACVAASGWLKKMIAERVDLTDEVAAKLVATGLTVAEFHALPPHKQDARLAEVGETFARRIIVHAECLRP